jgi:hypothetical protein
LISPVTESAGTGRFAYLITSYREPTAALRLARLIKTASPDALVIIRRDKAAATAIVAPDGVELWETAAPVDWNGPSQLDAIMSDLRRLRALGDIDWVTVLSEQCYPLIALPEYERRLAASTYDCFLDVSIEDNPKRERLLARYERRAYYVPGSRRPLVRALVKPLARLLPRAFEGGRVGAPMYVTRPRLRTPFGPDFRPSMGSDWMALGAESLRAVTDREGVRLFRYIRTCYAPNEGFFHTVLMNAPAIRVGRVNTHFIDWDEGGAHPRSLTTADLPAMLDSGAFFARKVDDEALIALLDARVSPHH